MSILKHPLRHSALAVITACPCSLFLLSMRKLGPREIARPRTTGIYTASPISVT